MNKCKLVNRPKLRLIIQMFNVSQEDKCLVELGQYLLASNYFFTTVTPATHERVFQRNSSNEADKSAEGLLRDLFGWNRPAALNSTPRRVIDLLEASGFISFEGDHVVSKIRFSTIDNLLILHSGFPTNEKESVFFGPDSYRFVRLLKQTINSADKIIDVGAGTGVGGMCIAQHLKRVTGKKPSLILSDINDTALRFARINVAINNFENVELVKSDILKNCPKGADVIIANPPFVIDDEERMYRHGGQHYGAELSMKIVDEAINYLNGKGQIVVYTGSAIVNGEDQFLKAVSPLVQKMQYEYSEIDPDIFGEQLSAPAYKDVERIAAVELTISGR